eukprot:8587213-Heterocapsa_arctica.AAC.1
MASLPANSTEFVDNIRKPFRADEDIRREGRDPFYVISLMDWSVDFWLVWRPLVYPHGLAN